MAEKYIACAEPTVHPDFSTKAFARCNVRHQKASRVSVTPSNDCLRCLIKFSGRWSRWPSTPLVIMYSFALILFHLSRGQRAKLCRYMVKTNTPQPSWIRVCVFNYVCLCVCVNVVHIVVFYQCRYSVFVLFYLLASASRPPWHFRLKDGRRDVNDERFRLPSRCVYSCFVEYIAYRSFVEVSKSASCETKR